MPTSQPDHPLAFENAACPGPPTRGLSLGPVVVQVGQLWTNFSPLRLHCLHRGNLLQLAPWAPASRGNSQGLLCLKRVQAGAKGRKNTQLKSSTIILKLCPHTHSFSHTHTLFEPSKLTTWPSFLSIPVRSLFD